MNKQGPNGIEWTEYTWNPIGGCQHDCKWRMPDGHMAQCYAKSIAEGVARPAYPDGFAHHYWRPDSLGEPLSLKEPAKIFLDSMSDLMGGWVPEDQIRQVLDVVWRAEWHTFQLLTKNAPRLLKFKHEFPPNLWVGVSLPPTYFLGRELSQRQQRNLYGRSLDILAQLSGLVSVAWMSFEPLSFDASDALWSHGCPLDWAVIGAASSGKTYYQPDYDHAVNLLRCLNEHAVPVFFKGNFKATRIRREFPAARPVTAGQLEMEL
jgi:protein gp37